MESTRLQYQLVEWNTCSVIRLSLYFFKVHALYGEELNDLSLYFFKVHDVYGVKSLMICLVARGLI